MSDVFNTQELLDFMCQSEKISGVIVTGDSIRNWREKISQKYSKLPGIRNLHDFLIVKNPSSMNAMMLVQDFCYEKAAKPAMPLNSDIPPSYNCCPTPDENYCELCKTRSLRPAKLAHLQQMFSKYIEPEKCFDFLKS